MPYPYVYYATYFMFQKDAGSDKVFCSCAQKSIKNYIYIRLQEGIYKNSDPCKMFILSTGHFPRAFVEECMKNNYPNDERIFNYLVFENNLCHECNRMIPSYLYCHPMYGGQFKQNYGWYINKQAYEYGVDPISFMIYYEIAPQQIYELIEMDPVKTRKLIQKLNSTKKRSDFEKAYELEKLLGKQERKIAKYIENETRIRFGHKKVGEQWVSETILYNIVKQILPDHTIHKHYRPSILEGLELDIYIEEIQVGIEYQGIQHFKPIKHWGGNENLWKTQERDKRKKGLCNTHGIYLIYYYYDEELSINLIKEKLKPFLK